MINTFLKVDVFFTFCSTVYSSLFTFALTVILFKFGWFWNYIRFWLLGKYGWAGGYWLIGYYIIGETLTVCCTTGLVRTILYYLLPTNIFK